MIVNEGMISLSCTKEIIRNLTTGTLNLSEGTIVNFIKELERNSEPFIDIVKEHLVKSNVLFVDESGIRINRKYIGFILRVPTCLACLWLTKKEGIHTGYSGNTNA